MDHTLLRAGRSSLTLEDIVIRFFRGFIKDDEGVTLIEYGLIAALIAVALATVLGTVGTNLNTVFTTVSTKI
jgi:pilus assembly protein Flp/PilA